MKPLRYVASAPATTCAGTSGLPRSAARGRGSFNARLAGAGSSRPISISTRRSHDRLRPAGVRGARGGAHHQA